MKKLLLPIVILLFLLFSANLSSNDVSAAGPGCALDDCSCQGWSKIGGACCPTGAPDACSKLGTFTCIKDPYVSECKLVAPECPAGNQYAYEAVKHYSTTEELLNDPRCGGSVGGNCPSECRAGSACGTGYTSAAGCGAITSTTPNFGCKSNQVCCKPNSCGKTTPTTSPCVTTSKKVTECRQANNCSGTKGSKCGTDTKGNPKYNCTYTKKTTVCSTPPPTRKPVITPTPTQIPIVAQCVSTKIYSPNWTAITTTEFYDLLPNSQVYFCTAGSTNAGAFDMARFTINGVSRPQTTLQRPGSSDYCDLYTIPSGVYSFSVQGEVHHNTLGWL